MLVQWFYAFVITPQVQMTAASSQLVNTTSNPFTDIPRTYKRPIDTVEGEPFRWERVPRPLKRNHRGMHSIICCPFQYLKATLLEEEQGKPPQGYRCRRCDGTDVRSFHRPTDCLRLSHFQHFVNDCPERAHPPKDYLCRICNNVRTSTCGFAGV